MRVRIKVSLEFVSQKRQLSENFQKSRKKFQRSGAQRSKIKRPKVKDHILTLYLFSGTGVLPLVPVILGVDEVIVVNGREVIKVVEEIVVISELVVAVDVKVVIDVFDVVANVDVDVFELELDDVTVVGGVVLLVVDSIALELIADTVFVVLVGDTVVGVRVGDKGVLVGFTVLVDVNVAVD